MLRLKPLGNHAKHIANMLLSLFLSKYYFLLFRLNAWAFFASYLSNVDWSNFGHIILAKFPLYLFLYVLTSFLGNTLLVLSAIKIEDDDLNGGYVSEAVLIRKLSPLVRDAYKGQNFGDSEHVTTIINSVLNDWVHCAKELDPTFKWLVLLLFSYQLYNVYSKPW
jgi:hypothetical protein